MKRIIYVECLEKLTKGTFKTKLFGSAETNSFCGNLSLVCGDDIGMRENLQLLGPTCTFSSRYFQDKDNSQYKEVTNWKNRVPRDTSYHLKIVNLIQTNKETHGKKKHCEILSQALGLTLEKSSFWDVVSFNSNIFFNFGNCKLHLEKEGNFSRVILYLGIKYGKQFCIAMNDVISQVTQDKRLLNLKKGIYKFNSQKGEITTKKYSGREMDNLSVILVMSLIKSQQKFLLLSKDIIMVQKYIELYYLLESRKWTEDSIIKLGDLIHEWKIMFIDCFDPFELNKEGNIKYSTSYPNFDSIDAWPYLIQRFGAPSWYSTDMWEATHKYLRTLKRAGNNKNIERDMLILDSKIKGFKYISNEKNMGLKQNKYNEKDYLELIGTNTRSTLDKIETDLLKKKYHNLSLPFNGDRKICVYNGLKFQRVQHINDFFILKQGKLTTLCKLLKIFTHDNNSWIKLQRFNHTSAYLDNHFYSAGPEDFISLKFEWDIKYNFSVHIIQYDLEIYLRNENFRYFTD